MYINVTLFLDSADEGEGGREGERERGSFREMIWRQKDAEKIC